IYLARFADQPLHAFRRFDDLPAVAQAVWLRCADAATRLSRTAPSEKPLDPALARAQLLEEVVSRFRELCREAEAGTGAHRQH
ncbi:hypothetical protein, partial [Acinetobacter baumannii]|uniref:hypothetical protein n=1 Tax=Acinetobacter baumannii TaxID=470 RepID=UPI0013D4C02C